MRSIQVASGELGAEGSCVGSISSSGLGGGDEDCVQARLMGDAGRG